MNLPFLLVFKRVFFHKIISEYNDSEDPVDEHGIPYPQHIFVPEVYKEIGQPHTEHCHGKNGDFHGKGRFADCPEIIGEQKCDRPDDHGCGMGQNESFRQPGGKGRQVVTADPETSAYD